MYLPLSMFLAALSAPLSAAHAPARSRCSQCLLASVSHPKLNKQTQTPTQHAVTYYTNSTTFNITSRGYTLEAGPAEALIKLDKNSAAALVDYNFTVAAGPGVKQADISFTANGTGVCEKTADLAGGSMTFTCKNLTNPSKENNLNIVATGARPLLLLLEWVPLGPFNSSGASFHFCLFPITLITPSKLSHTQQNTHRRQLHRVRQRLDGRRQRQGLHAHAGHLPRQARRLLGQRHGDGDGPRDLRARQPDDDDVALRHADRPLAAARHQRRLMQGAGDQLDERQVVQLHQAAGRQDDRDDQDA